MHHNDANGNRIHDPPAMEKKLAMHMAQEVVEAVPKSTDPLKKSGIKPQSNMSKNQGSILFSTYCQSPNSTVVKNLYRFVVKKCLCYQEQMKKLILMVNILQLSIGYGFYYLIPKVVTE